MIAVPSRWALTLNAAQAAGEAAWRLGAQGPRASEVAEVFPDLDPAEAQVVARTIAGHRFANAAARRIGDRSGGAHALAGAFTRVEAEPLLAARRAGRPTVLVPWHGGIVNALGGALVRLALPALIVRFHAPRHPVPGLTYALTQGGHAAALMRAVRHARAGGLVVLPVDVNPHGAAAAPAEAQEVEAPATLTSPRNPPVESTFGIGPSASATRADGSEEPEGTALLLGRRVRVPEGPAALARLADAVLIPVAVDLTSRGLTVTCFDPVAPDHVDVHGALVAAWERRLRAQPGTVGLDSLRRLLAWPRVA